MVDSFVFRVTKRSIDVGISLAALCVLGPLMLVLAAIIKFADGGPVVFKQYRVGRYGVPFPFYKFRSMTVNAESLRDSLLIRSDAKGAAFKMEDDPRVTGIGRFIRKYSLDELPQFFCVLAGHMTIVGPRPLPIIEGYACSDAQMVRYFIKPGLFCFREVTGRSRLSFDEWMESDVRYYRERSLWLDFRIMAMVLPAIVKADGAF